MKIIEPRVGNGAFKKSFQPVIKAFRLSSSIIIAEIDRKPGPATSAKIKEKLTASNVSHIKSKSILLLGPSIEGAAAFIGTKTMMSNCNGITAMNIVVIPTRHRLPIFEITRLKFSLKRVVCLSVWL